MKKIISLILCHLALCTPSLIANSEIIAHRGYWKTGTVAQNSLESLEMAQFAKCWGSECDVYISNDGIPVVNHDRSITKDKLVVEDTSSEKLLSLILRNGETLPSFEEYVKQAKKNTNTKLIVELEGHSTGERDAQLAQECANIIKKYNLEKHTEYISFSMRVIKKMLAVNPKAKCYYLSGNLTPKEAKEAGCYGIDYSVKALKENPQWIKEAQDLGMKVNVWTVNDRNDLQFFIEHGVDYITTDEPVFAQKLVHEWEKNKCFSTKNPESPDL